MQKSISLAMIVSNNDYIKAQKAIKSVEKYVDEICITIADKEFGTYVNVDKKKFSFWKWNDNFADARSYNFSQCKSDWILWLDADDTLEGAENLQDVIKLGEDNKVDAFAFLYKYGFDKDGNCNDQHWKTQFLKNNMSFEWRGAIHEDPIQLVPLKWAKTEMCTRVHHTTDNDTVKSYERNLRILESERIKNPTEPRTLFYLGRTYLASGQFQETVDVLSEYLTLSGWNEERYEARLLIGQALFHGGDIDDALSAYNDAIIELEKYPDAYIYKGMCYLKKENYKDALQNFEIAVIKNRPDANTYYNPMLYSQKLPEAMATCYMHIGQFDKALQYIKYSLQANNKDEGTLLLYKTILHVKEIHDTSKAFADLSVKLERRGNVKLIETLLNATPADLTDNPFIVSVRGRFTQPKKWSDNSIVIYCGNSPEVWNPAMVSKGGIGGSETAVIELSKRLVAKGFEVTVFNRCEAKPEGDIYDGVVYKNYWEFNFKDEYNIVWSWRLPELFDYDLKSKFSLIDLHDVMNPLDFTEERLSKIDKLFVKTKYHRNLLPNIPDDKFVVIGNGITLDRFKNNVTKNPHRFIYSSTPNRGLDILLEYMWDDIVKEIPDAEIHTYYGFNTFYELEKNNPERMLWMKKMQKLMEKPGVVNHGRVNQAELASDILKSSFWLYPTFFAEIHCITACEMQAGGCIPITSGYAALEETVLNGITVEGDVYDPKYHKEFVSKVVEMAKKDNIELINKTINDAQSFDWDIVADEWYKQFSNL